jgi:hypothetical protein
MFELLLVVLTCTYAPFTRFFAQKEHHRNRGGALFVAERDPIANTACGAIRKAHSSSENL